jgi:hypothetical protein
MKTFIVSMIALCSLSAFASTTVNCKSANYTINVADIEEFSFANYGINGKMNEGASVEMEDSYLSGNILAFSLKVDEKSKKFEVVASKSGAKTYSGKIFTDKVVQAATCTRK